MSFFFLFFSDSPQVTSEVEIFNETTKVVALNCTVMANPPPRYTWYSTNLRKAFNKDNPVLYTSSLGPGNYTCTASNGIGSVSKLFIVQVKRKGGFHFTFAKKTKNLFRKSFEVKTELVKSNQTLHYWYSGTVHMSEILVSKLHKQ